MTDSLCMEKHHVKSWNTHTKNWNTHKPRSDPSNYGYITVLNKVTFDSMVEFSPHELNSCRDGDVQGCPRLMRQLDTYWDGEHSWQSTDRNIEKIEIPPRWPFRDWLILNGHRGGIFIFFFFGPVDCHNCSRGVGGGGARDCERDPQNDVATRSHLSVCPGFE